LVSPSFGPGASSRRPFDERTSLLQYDVGLTRRHESVTAIGGKYTREILSHSTKKSADDRWSFYLSSARASSRKLQEGTEIVMVGPRRRPRRLVRRSRPASAGPSSTLSGATAASAFSSVRPAATAPFVELHDGDQLKWRRSSGTTATVSASPGIAWSVPPLRLPRSLL
jgi:hypothetical protein